MSLGAPVWSAAQLVACVAAVLVLDLGIRLVRRSDPGEAIFYLCAIVVFPLLLAIVRGSPILYVRHFLLPIAFVLLLLGALLGALWRHGPRGRAAAAALLAAYGIANAAHLRALFVHGRGENAAALRFVLAESAPGLVSSGRTTTFGSSASSRSTARRCPAESVSASRRAPSGTRRGPRGSS